MKAIVKIPNVSWRDGRPRFNPGPKLRKLGFKGEDLRHADGRWYELREAEDWVKAKAAEISARKQKKAAGQRLPPLRRPGAYTIEDMFEDLYRSKNAYLAKSPKTQSDYKIKAKSIGKVDPLLYGVAAAELTKGAVVGLHEQIWEERGLAMANGMIAVLRLAYSEAILRGRGGILVNPCLKLKLQQPEPRLRCASVAEIAALMATADALEPSIGDAIVIALFTGQRRGDVLALSEEGVEGGRAKMRQRKTAAPVSVRALPQLLARFATIRARDRAANRVTTTLVTDPRSGRPWNESSFSHRFAELRAAAVAGQVAGDMAAGDAAAGRAPCPSLADFRFSDLRDTAVTWLARAGCTIPEIASVTGHSEGSIHTILKHYLLLDETINDAAMAKLRAWAEREGVTV